MFNPSKSSTATRPLVQHKAKAQMESVGSRADAVRLALLLTYITLGWMTIEGAAALLLGWASKSLLLEAFGIDSVIELFSAAVLLWRLRVEAGGSATSERVILVEDRAARLVGYRSEEHTSELQSLTNLVCRLLLEKKKKEKNK